MDKLDEMVEGYLDGKSDFRHNFPHANEHRSLAYKHGWLNGRDDRTSLPRDRASVLVARADLILKNT